MSADAVGQRQRIHVALAQLDAAQARLGQLGARQPQHLRRCGRCRCALSARAAEQFDHPAGAGADIDQPPDRRVAKRARRSPPRLRSRRHGASGSRPSRRRGRRNSAPRLRRGRRAPPSSRAASAAHCAAPFVAAQRSIDCEQRLGPRRVGQASGTPSCLPCGARRARRRRGSDMARHARLALPEHLRELADGQLHRPQQRQDAQPAGIGKRLEKRRKG